MRGQLVELLAGARITIGGSRESAANDWQVNPTGTPSSSAVTMVMPVAKWPSTSRNRAWSRPDNERLRLAEVDRLGLVGRRDVLDVLGLGQLAGQVEDLVDLAVGVGGVVVGQEEALGAGLGRHVHGEGGGRVPPVGLHRELVVGVLPVVHEQVDAVAQ